ncbi:PREDICTED: dymeclin-like, partial [Galeopterus variegatus]|uniref:Dymeclin n=1 Tax=Galeopterus variegatus TaxID=482537 RepID=A0ABM0PZW2_GALVR
TELKLLEEATISVCRSLVENNPRTGNLGALIKVFLSRTKELKLSAECQNHIFIWQTHNALFIICCLLKVFICEMSEEELQLHFTYEEKSPGSYWKKPLEIERLKIEAAEGEEMLKRGSKEVGGAGMKSTAGSIGLPDPGRAPKI